MSKQTERDAFRSRWGFILACIGSAVGMGNIWRFPYLVSAWGGMTFLLPYFLFVLLIGSTGIIGEMALGRSTLCHGTGYERHRRPLQRHGLRLGQ